MIRTAAALALIAWCVVVVALRRPAQITDDWMGWRQADTQAIARNFVEEGFTPLHPRIDWRGDGPGFVETEAQLYPALIAATMAVAGVSEWPGQLLSLACTAFALALLAAALARRYGEPAGLVALLALLGHQGTLAIATSIQPDSLALLLFVIGWLAFLADLEAPSRRMLAVWIAATALAGLVKPTTLELGIAQFVLAAFAHRLRSPRLWLGWAIVVAVVIAYLAYARTLYVTYGNTFGVLSGGDSKLPAAAMLKDPETWTGLARYGIQWGVGVLAVPAAIYLAWRRALEPAHYALALGAALLVLIALRYTSGTFGTHYHLPHVVLGGWLVAAAAARLGRPRIVLAIAAACSLALGARSLHFLHALRPEPETTLGARLAALARPGTLVVVRARAEGFNTEWHTANNFEDPRVFYLSRTKGWVLPNDLAGASPVADAAARGARFYVHVHQKPLDPELAHWLAAHATLVTTSPAGEIYGLARTK
ncbi:MAG: glycosyltransferase family 39 protein [Deltaproteobacteria bacterium]